MIMSHACLWSDIRLTAAGSEAGRESVEEGERHPGGEGERHPADSAPTGLRQHGNQSEQRRALTGELEDRCFQPE